MHGLGGRRWILARPGLMPGGRCPHRRLPGDPHQRAPKDRASYPDYSLRASPVKGPGNQGRQSSSLQLDLVVVQRIAQLALVAVAGAPEVDEDLVLLIETSLVADEDGREPGVGVAHDAVGEIAPLAEGPEQPVEVVRLLFRWDVDEETPAFCVSALAVPLSATAERQERPAAPVRRTGLSWDYPSPARRVVAEVWPMTMTLYHCPRTRSERVRWALEELGLAYRLEVVDLHKGEGNGPAFRAINPLGQLPALVIDGEVMLESGAIVHWLADRYGDHRLAPPLESPSRRAYEQWSFFAVTNLEEPAWEIVLHRDILPAEAAVKAIIPFVERRLDKLFERLEGELAGRDYLVADGFSAADILTGYILMWFPRELARYPALEAYVERFKARPAYQRSG
jgi:glutathione S-transferase